jgi:hypothetical protein
MSSLVSTKRKRLGDKDWTILFEDASPLRCIVDTIASLMTRVTFKVKRDSAGESGFALVVNGNDIERSCAVSCHLDLDKVTFSDAQSSVTEFSFCIDAKQMLNSLDTPSCQQGCVTLEGHSSTAEIRLEMFDPDQHAHVSSSVLSTFANDEPYNTVRPQKYEFLLEVDLHHVREIIKKGRKCRAEKLGIEVHFLRTVGAEWSRVFFVVQGDDNSVHDQCFTNEVTKTPEGDSIVRAANPSIEVHAPAMDTDSGDPFFRGYFSLDKVEAFVKNVPSKMVTVFMKNGTPIMFVHNLRPGDDPDRNYVRFLAAPCTEDD